MPFTVEAWKQQAAQKFKEIGRWLEQSRKTDLPYVVYGTVAGLSLWPLVQAAVQTGQFYDVIGALYRVAAGVGADLIASQLEAWKERAQRPTEEEVNQWTSEQAADANLRERFDAILQWLEAIQLAQQSVPAAERDRFVETLRDELRRLGNLQRYEAVLIGRGSAIAQGNQATAAAERAIVARSLGIGVTGDSNLIFISDQAAAALLRRFLPDKPTSDLQQATARYLKYLLDRYRFLDFRGMGVSDRVPLKLALVDLYVPLRARVELPEGETWARELKLAGRPLSEEEAEATGTRLSEPLPVLDLIQKNDGLIILGDPGAGKTTFLKYLALMLAAGQGDALGLGSRLPLILPLSAYAGALAGHEGNGSLSRFVTRYYRDLVLTCRSNPCWMERWPRAACCCYSMGWMR